MLKTVYMVYKHQSYVSIKKDENKPTANSKKGDQQ